MEVPFIPELFKDELKKIINNNVKYKLWCENLIFEYNCNKLSILVENKLFADKIKTNFESFFWITAQRLKLKLKFVEYDIKRKDKMNQIHNPKPIQRELFYTDKILSKLEPSYNFDNYIVDESNKFAYKSSIAVIQKLGNLFNPLYIYGDDGVGKSHLIQGLIKHIDLVQPQINLKFFKAESFKNLYIKSLRNKNMVEFRERFRLADIFVFENIENIENCYSVQEEFFHIYNKLLDMGSQLIISSTKPPQKLKNFMPRLINRLKKGLVVDILKPTYNLKFELVKSKIEDSELFLTPNLIKYFIEKCNTDNLKNLNFYLNKIIAFFSVTRQNFNEKTIDDIVNKASVLPEIITVEDIQKHVSRYFNIKVEDIRSKLRTKELVLPKHIAMYLCRELTDYSLKKISSDFGKVDKTTISHAYRKVKKLINSDDKMCCTVKNLTKLLFNRELCHK